MRKVIKSQTVNNSDEVVAIPDIPPGDFTLLEESAPDLSEQNVINIAEYEKMLQAAKMESRQIRDKILKMTNAERNAILTETQSEANKIAENARKEAENIIAQANAQYHDVLEQARNEGFNAGVLRKGQDIDDFITEIRQTLTEMQTAQGEYMREYEKELKWLALEIARKVIAHKMEENELILVDILKSAIAAVRDVKWISVEISSGLSKLVKNVMREISVNEGVSQVDVHTIEDTDKGTCIIQFPDRVIDASVLTSLKNIEEYFKELDEVYNATRDES